jgi:hypothetical protein
MGVYFLGPQSYVVGNIPLLAKIYANGVGRVVVDAIDDTDKDWAIVPRDKGKVAVDGSVCNADTVSDKTINAVPKDVSQAAGPLYRGDVDNPATREDERYDTVPFGVTGTGKGSDGKIYFSADEWVKSSCDTKGIGSQTDEVLVHEMVHALRNAQGKSNWIPTNNKRYDNDEEFLAVVVTNVYISAKGGARFRADHWGHKELKPPLNTSKGFLGDPDNLKIMSIYRLVWTAVFTALAGVASAQFNPFRELSNMLRYQGPLGTQKTAPTAAKYDPKYFSRWKPY